MKTKTPFISLMCLVGLMWLSPFTSGGSLSAQCTAQNTAFEAGERLDYQLYFNWKFVWVKAGTATLSTSSDTYQGKQAYKSHLITSTSKRLDDYFMMRDTLEAIYSLDMLPYYYKKAANEGGKYYVDEVWYTPKQSGGAHLKQRYLSRAGEITEKETDVVECVYDMVSMMMRARSFEASQFKEGDRMIFPMADGRKVEPTQIVYRGKQNFTMRGSKITYRCLVFSFVEETGKKGKEKEIITFYITDDDNHVPVRLDMFLKFGTAKAYLVSSNGLRHECSSIVKK